MEKIESACSQASYFVAVHAQNELPHDPNYRRGFGPSGMVLLLTACGRKSGLPLYFERADLERFAARK